MRVGDSFWQIVRFGVSGAALTVLVSALYILAMNLFGISPALSLTIATVLASIAGYFVHAEFSFRGHGGRDNFVRRFVRFCSTNAIGYALNLAFVYAIVDLARLPAWMPVIAFCTVTPMVSFLLNRNWVFG